MPAPVKKTTSRDCLSRAAKSSSSIAALPNRGKKLFGLSRLSWFCRLRRRCWFQRLRRLCGCRLNIQHLDIEYERFTGHRMIQIEHHRLFFDFMNTHGYLLSLRAPGHKHSAHFQTFGRDFLFRELLESLRVHRTIPFLGRYFDPPFLSHFHSRESLL